MSVSEVNLRHLLLEIQSLKRKLDALQPLPAPVAERVQRYFRLEISYHHNQLAGVSLSYESARHLVHSNPAPNLETGSVAARWLAHDAALLLLYERQASGLPDLSLEDIYQLQTQLNGGAIPQRRGSHSPGRSVGKISLLAQVDQIDAQLTELLNWCQHYAFDTHPLWLAAEWPAGMARIAPFTQGNERLGLLLLNHILLRAGYPPIVIPSEDAGAFRRAVDHSIGGNLTYLAEYIGKRLVLSLEIVLQAAAEHNQGATVPESPALVFSDRPVRAFPPEAVRARLHDSLGPLLEALLQETTGVDAFFAEKQQRCSLYHPGGLEQDIPEQFERLVDTACASGEPYLAEIVFRWSGFREPTSAAATDLQVALQMRFDAGRYTFHGPDLTRPLLSKSVQWPLLPGETADIVRAISVFLADRLRVAVTAQ